MPNFQRFDDDDDVLYEEKERQSKTFAPGTIVDCLVFDIGHPSAYQKRVDDLASQTGLDPEYSYKDGGVELAVAVVSVYNDKIRERVFTEDGKGNITGFSIMPYVNLSSSTPKTIYEKKYQSFIKGISTKLVNGSPKTVSMFPWLPNGKNAEKDAERITEWQGVLDRFDNFSEEEAYNACLKMIAQRQGFGITEGEKFTLVRPQIGMLFQAKISYGKKKRDDGTWADAAPSLYFNINRWETELTDGKFNDVFHVNFDVKISDETIAFADAIRFFKEESLARYKADKAEVPF